MSEISIHAYHERIEKLIEESRLAEAVTHCRHILNQHPRHIATYRLLGKAFLEQQQYSSAVDLFQRVLSADPEDFIAHIGLSIAYKAEQLQTQAIWHMERAFEIDPYNAVIQDELKALYAQRDGIAPERLILTQGALARLHYRSGLYPQAIAATRELLAADPGRVDLQTLLAEALWRDDQRVDAVAICLNLLQTLPNCIKANAILAEVWLQTGRISEAHHYMQRLQPLTLLDHQYAALETPVGSAFRTEGALPVPPEQWVDELDDAELLHEEVAEPAADWVSELTRLDESDDAVDVNWFDDTPDLDWFKAPPQEPTAIVDDVPDWLREISDETGMDLFDAAAEPLPTGESPTLMVEDESEEDVAPMDAAADDALPILEDDDGMETSPALDLVDMDEAFAAADADFADWLDQTLVEHGDAPPEPVAAVSPPVMPDPRLVANLPDWLRDDEADGDEESVPASNLLDELALLAADEEDDDADDAPAAEARLMMTLDEVPTGELPDWVRAGIDAAPDDEGEFPAWQAEDPDPFPAAVHTGALSGFLADDQSDAPNTDDEDLQTWFATLADRENTDADPFSANVENVTVAMTDSGDLTTWLDEMMQDLAVEHTDDPESGQVLPPALQFEVQAMSEIDDSRNDQLDAPEEEEASAAMKPVPHEEAAQKAA
ncbi:MAG: tetratricopeptide repeat protein, partial [Anaerolineales bacterium]|nr:tetratricopeptide repeat protein [Anaerolineales bacterium]